jgi:hypothetical protein
MLFNVEQDEGHRITGYLVPDSFSGQRRIRVCADGRELAVLETIEFRNSLVVAGRHDTGRCGFSVDDSFVPGLCDIKVLEILDAETGLLVYRRAPLDLCISKKLMRLETRQFPLHQIDSAVKGLFRHHYCDAERAGLESATQMFLVNEEHSMYISGRLMYKNFEYCIDQGFSIVCMIQDPFEELAERLIWCRMAARRNRDQLDLRDQMTFEAAIAMTAELDLMDERQLRKRFARLSLEEATAFTSPLVRQLSARNAYEMPRAGSLPSALDALSACAVVGLRARSEMFAVSLASFLGVDGATIPAVGRSVTAARLADRLRGIRPVHTLLELDLEVYRHAVDAYDAAMEAVGEPICEA